MVLTTKEYCTGQLQRCGTEILLIHFIQQLALTLYRAWMSFCENPGTSRAQEVLVPSFWSILPVHNSYCSVNVIPILTLITGASRNILPNTVTCCNKCEPRCRVRT